MNPTQRAALSAAFDLMQRTALTLRNPVSRETIELILKAARALLAQAESEYEPATVEGIISALQETLEPTETK